MGVTADQLVGDAADDVVDREGALLLGEPRQEDDLEQQVAELLAVLVRIVPVQGVQDLVGLLQEVAPERGVSLLAIPGAVAAQLRHDVVELDEA